MDQNQINPYSHPIFGKRKVTPPKPIRGTKITILGCGTSAGVPLLGCQCSTCTSKERKNKRTRASIVVQSGDKNILIDTSPDLRTQALTNNLLWVDAVLITHPHADHIHGIDDLRSFNFLKGDSMPVYGNEWSMETIRTRFDYIFKITQLGGGKPQLELQTITKPVKIGRTKVIPLHVDHGKVPVLGYRINDIAYITDTSYVPDRTFKLLKNLDVLVLDCLRPAKHPTHLNTEEALELANRVGAKRTYFTHMGHELEYKKFSSQLNKVKSKTKMKPAFDGLIIHSPT